MNRKALIALLGAAVAVALPGYVRETNSRGALVSRSDVTELRFEINDRTAAGMTNADGDVIITPSSDPLTALRTATERWNAISQSRVFFQPLTLTPDGPNGGDRRHIITFVDTPEARDIVGDATAVTLFFSTADGSIVDSDIYFSPKILDADGNLEPFATNGAPGTHDILSNAIHELGHCFGMNHTNVLGATMFQFGRVGETFAGTLSADDVAFTADVYPTPDGQSGYGRIRGTALLDGGQPIRGGMVAASDAWTGVVIGALTDLTTGQYELLAPPGNYVVYVEPLDGPVTPRNLSLEDAAVTLPFQPARFGGADGGQTVTVSAGGVAVADLTAQAGEPALSVELLGLTVGSKILLGQGPRLLSSGQETISLWGPGLENVAADGVEVLGPDVALVPGSVLFEPRLATQGYPGALRFKVNVEEPAAPSQAVPGGSLSTILIRSGGRTAAYTAALVVEPITVSPPTFSADGVANAASFLAGPVAPGELVSIFGLDLGPETPLSANGFDPDTGLLATTLGGVEVSFDGVPAPLVFVSQQQINLQVPYETAGRSSTNVAIRNGGVAGATVSVPVAATAPGIFVIQGTAGAILNQNGSLNSAASPEQRGHVVVVYGVGQGLVNPSIATGAPATGELRRRDDVTAVVGDRPATVLFAGLAPGFVGLLQVNLMLPADAPTGDAVPIRIAVDGKASQTGVTVSIAP
ncbi:MAG: hypothetical protein GC160_03970 [Acidobacteria bacterium]|nr:hypothetical protein [Acidobacteriota bacterium]